MAAADPISRARDVMSIEMEGIACVRDGLGADFVRLVEMAAAATAAGGKLVLCGVGKSGHVGHKIAATLASTGTPAVFMHPVEAMHGDLGILSPGDLLVALSYSGETDELLAVLPAAKRLGAPVVAITGDGNSRLAGWADLVVPMAVPREACPFNLAPTTTTTALLALGDALAIVLLERRGFSKTDYARLHPSGAIGRSITLAVTDIMRTGDAFPRVGPDTSVRDALLAMTRARSGSVAVVAADNRLMGIFTDGDFRRHIMDSADVLEASIAAVMTPRPITVGANAMAVEVLKLLEARHIDDIIVVDQENRAVGLVDVQDLPRFKIM